jgi:2-oxoglutarate ferredoxin oxidoreductase subunit beta
MGSPVKMMKYFQERAVTIEKAQLMKDEELEGKVRIGILTDSDKPSYLEKYHPVRERAKASLKK